MWVPGLADSKPAAARPAANPPAPIAATVAPSTGSSVQAKDRLIGALAYMTLIPAVVFLFVEPLKHDRFVRFHSFQSIFLALATIAIAIAMWIIFAVLSLVPVIGFLLAWLALAVAVLGWVILWLVVVVKALQGATFKLPVIGNLAGKT
jgi:uncharacterized membrane protein